MKDQLKISDESGDRKYFTIIPNYVYNHSTMWDREVYCQMKRISGENGTCWMSRSNLAKQCGMSVRRLDKSLKYLIDHKWIDLIGKKEVMTKGGEQEVNEYKIIDLWDRNNSFYQEKNKGVAPGAGGAPGAHKEEPFNKGVAPGAHPPLAEGKEIKKQPKLPQFKKVKPCDLPKIELPEILWLVQKTGCSEAVIREVIPKAVDWSETHPGKKDGLMYLKNWLQRGKESGRIPFETDAEGRLIPVGDWDSGDGYWTIVKDYMGHRTEWSMIDEDYERQLDEYYMKETIKNTNNFGDGYAN